MITCKFREGRLGEVMNMVYGLFYFCIRNNIPLDQIIIDKNYKGKAFFTDSYTNVIKDNFQIFNNIQNIFVNHIEDIIKNPEVIDLKFQEYQKDIFNYDKNKDYILSNYWIMPINKKLFKSLFKSNILINRLISQYNNIDFNRSLSVHVRRGDFQKIKDNIEVYKKYPNKIPLTKKEIINNIDLQLKQNHDIQNIIFFSDDIDWCKNNLKNFKKNIIYMNNKPYEDMTLMSMCRYNIISKGSYFSYCAMFMK